MPVTKKFNPQTPSDDYTCARSGDLDLDEKIQAGKASFQVTDGTANQAGDGQFWMWSLDSDRWELFHAIDANEMLANGHALLAKPRN